MGTIYLGPFSEQADTASHEGYAAQIRADGTETASYALNDEFDHHRAACECGWRGPRIHPATDEGEEQAVAEWWHTHLWPLVIAVAERHTVRADLLLFWIEGMRVGLRYEPDSTVFGGQRLSEHSRGIADAVDALGDYLDEHATTETR